MEAVECYYYVSYFATQYKEYFVFCSIQSGTNVVETTDQVSILSGCTCITNVVEVDREGGHIWSAIPQLSLQLCTEKDIPRVL